MRQLLPLFVFLMLAACGGKNDVGANAAPPQAAPSASPEAKRLLEEAIDDFTAGRIDISLAKLEQAAEHEPRNAKVQAWLGRAYSGMARLSEAKLAHREAARFAGDATLRMEQSYLAAAAALQLARARMDKGDYSQAAAQARDALADNPELVEARALLAGALFHLQEFREALAEYQRVSEETAGAARRDALNWVAHCHLRLRDGPAAEQVFNALIREGYTANDVFGWRAACRKERKDYEGARMDLLRALDVASSEEMHKDLQKELRAVEALITGAENGK